MAEPLSIAASIVTLLELTAKAIKYLNDVKDGPNERIQLLTEISSVKGLLHMLKDQAEKAEPGDTSLKTIRSLNVPDGPLDQFQRALERLIPKLKPAHGPKKLAKALTWSLEKGEVKSILSQIERQKALFLLALQNDHLRLSGAIKDILFDTRSGVEDLKTKQRRLARNINRKLEAGSYNLTRHFETWKQANGSFLWLYGKPGCGKTVLCSTIIKALDPSTDALSDTALAYFYFDFNEPKKQHPDESERVQELYILCGNGIRRPSSESLRLWLSKILKDSPRTFLVLDALDECIEREELLESIETIKRWSLPNVNILTTSRRESYLEEVLKPLSTCTVSIESAKIDDDVRQYIDHRLGSDAKLKRCAQNPDLKQTIVSALVKGADGMFRWVVCQMDALTKCLDPDAVLSALKKLPKTLYETYDRILKNIDEDYRAKVFTVLQWLAFAARPVLLEEVAEAVSMVTEVRGPLVFDPKKRLFDPSLVLEMCSSLVTLSKMKKWTRCIRHGDDKVYEEVYRKRETNELRLAHFSVKEYLLSQRVTADFQIEEIPANVAIAKGCLAYLLYFRFDMTSDASHFQEFPFFDDGRYYGADISYVSHCLKYPLLAYAGSHWFAHVRAVPERSSQPDLDSMLVKFLDENEKHFLNWQRVDHDHEQIMDGHASPKFLPLHVASHLRLPRAVGALIRNGVNINAESDVYGNALQTAVEHGSKEIVQLLLYAGADVNAQGGYFYGNALHAAKHLLNGLEREAMIELLLAHGAIDVGADGWSGCC